MNVRLSASLLNSDVAAAISFYVNQNILEKSNETTAWFLRIMHKWFKYMTGRYCKYALSHNNEEKYDEAITFINSVMEIFTKINVEKVWKPYQTGLLLCSQTAFDFLNSFY
jgi:hypothetical protein